MTKLRILFAGAYGIENAGDDLPMVVMTELLRRQRPDIDFEFSAFSRHPNLWEADQYGVSMIPNVEHATREEARGRGFRGFNIGDDPSPLIATEEAIRAADCLVLGAGNWLIDLCIGLCRGPIPLLQLYVLLAKKHNRPTYLFGMSAGPLRTQWGRELTQWIVEQADLVTVRDRPSLELLTSLLSRARSIELLPDATLGAEPALPDHCERLLAAEGIHKRRGTRWLGIGLRDLSVVLDGATLEGASEELARFCNGQGERFELLFVPQCTYPNDDDRAAARGLASCLGDHVTCHHIEKRHHPSELIGMYGLCDVALTVRLHAAVFAAIAGTPVVAIEYLPKVRGFMEFLGAEDLLVPVDRIDVPTLSKTLERALQLTDIDRERQAERIDGARRQVESYATLLLEHLSSACSYL